MIGEAAVIAAGLKRASRFRQVSVPALWGITKLKGEGDVGARVRVHARRVIWEVFRAHDRKEDLIKILTTLGEIDLARQLGDWNKEN